MSNQSYETLCNHLFQDIVDIASYLLGKNYNVESLEDRSNVADEIVAQIKKHYEGVPDTVMSLEGGSDEYNSLRETVNKVVSDQLPGIVEKVRKELGI